MKIKWFKAGRSKKKIWLTLLDWILVVLALALMLYFPRFDVPLARGLFISYILIIGGVIHIACLYFLRERDSVSAAGVIYYILLLLSVSAPVILVIGYVIYLRGF